MTFRDAPPSPLGMITADCPWQSREAWEAAQAAQRSPSSNTGMILPSGPESAHAPAFVDYLKFTLRGLRRLVEKARRLDDDGRLDDSLSELRAVFAVDAVGGWDVTPAEQTRAGAMLDAIAQDAKGSTVREPLSESKLDRAMVVFARVLIQAHAPALVFGDLTGKGRDGYKNHAKIYTHLGQECGFIAVGGNAETVHVNLTGEACRRLDVPAFADALDAFDHKIGRIDTAFDDLAGEFGHVSRWAQHYRDGGFAPTLGGVRSNKVLWLDDLGSGNGSTFNLGDRSSRMLRIYMKGQQLGDSASPWVRYEIQYMGAAFDLTTDNLRHPGALLRQYPDLEFLPVDGAGQACSRVRRQTEIELEKTAKWLRVTCGAALTMLSESLGAETVVHLIENDKVPRRMRCLGDSRQHLGELLADALMDSRKCAPIASSPIFQSAEQRVRQWKN